jgi:hypothetical protein
MGQMKINMSKERRARSFGHLQCSIVRRIHIRLEGAQVQPSPLLTPFHFLLQTPWAAAWLVAVLLPMLGAVTGQTNSTHDLLALQQLNASINNPPAAGTAPGMRSWVGTAFCNGWQGVLCNDQGRVWSLQIPGVRLSGTIPASIRKCSNSDSG